MQICLFVLLLTWSPILCVYDDSMFPGYPYGSSVNTITSYTQPYASAIAPEYLKNPNPPVARGNQGDVCCSDGNFYKNLGQCYSRKLVQVAPEFCTAAASSSTTITCETNIKSVAIGNGYQPGSRNGQNCGCNSVMNIVCGSDGVTYTSACRATCNGADAVFYGTCDTSITKQCGMSKCAAVANPVCADDGVTYESRCLAVSLNVAVSTLSEGFCARPCGCDATYAPVCGGNGVTYPNACQLRCAKVTQIAKGKCEAKQVETCSTCYERKYKPVCATNGKTYDNQCFMKCDGAQYMSDGFCDTGNCMCSNVYLPVCAANGRTYRNQCRMACDGTKLDYNGICEEGTNEDCMYRCSTGINDSPMCMNGVTYGNSCMMQCYTRDSSRQAQESTVYDGPCPIIKNPPECRCRDYTDPVCGENGYTYQNECVAYCYNQPIAYGGECPYNGRRDPGYNPYDFGCNDACKRKFFADTSNLAIPYRRISKDEYDAYRYGSPCNGPACGSPCVGGQCGAVAYQLPGLAFTPANPFSSAAASQTYITSAPSVNQLSTLYYGTSTAPATATPTQVITQSPAPTPPVTLYRVISQPQSQPSTPQPQRIFAMQQRQASQSSTAAGTAQTFTDSSVAAGPGSQTTTFNYGTNLGQINIDFSTSTQTADIPDSLKLQFQKAPYLYYMYFYSLLYYRYATPETRVQGVMIKDILLYIAQTLLKIVPDLSDKAGQTVNAAPGSPSQANYAIRAQIYNPPPTNPALNTGSSLFYNKL